MSDWRLAVDIGGTFTDVVLLDGDSGAVTVEKTLTTPSAPLEAVRNGIRSVLTRAGLAPGDLTNPIVHATTLVTNALIEGKTGRAALVTTTGFGDTLLIRTEHRYDMYDLQIEFPDPPVDRALTFELDERTNARGEILASPDEATLDSLASRIEAAGAEAVAVCLLNSYINPANERLVAEAIAKRIGLPVCVSSEVAPQIREYQRMITTACNAATMPVLGPYLGELRRWLDDEGFGVSVLMMLSNGGVVSATEAARLPIRLVESGPAAGALAGAWHAGRLAEERLLCFDMGGTTAKSCLIEHGRPSLTNQFEVARVYRFKKGSGFPCSVPSVDLVEIGAGGGSLAHLDGLGLLKVGPESAGADPGPAAYGRGGTAPAVTDADLHNGYLDAEWFLGGDMALDMDACTAALARVGEPLGATVADVAMGIHDVVNQNMAASARMHAIERGVDLHGVSLIAFGGAGPVHACGVAELLESPRVVFPVNASVLSAFGTLVSPVRIDLARSMVHPLDDSVVGRRDALLDEMRSEGSRVLAEAGVDPSSVRFRYGLDARYVGQGNEVTVWVGEGEEFPTDPEATAESFHREYEQIYGLRIPGVGVEVVTWRLAAYAPPPEFEVPTLPPPDPSAGERVRSRQARFTRGPSTDVAVPVHRRSELVADQRIEGPAIVEERETTIVLRPGWTARVLPDGTIIADSPLARGGNQ